jgi:hypothetical protein
VAYYLYNFHKGNLFTFSIHYHFQKGNIQVETGRHPRGDNTSINWSEVPTEVDPGLGTFIINILL